LISATLRKDAAELAQTYADNGYVLFTTWDDLIERAKYSHKQFRDILEKKATEAETADEKATPKRTTKRSAPKKRGKRK
jgi:hypothetical protein